MQEQQPVSGSTDAVGNHESVTDQHAYDEAMRELQVRERLYARWVKEGKISRTDARVRLDSQARICFLLASLPTVKVMAEDGPCF